MNSECEQHPQLNPFAYDPLFRQTRELQIRGAQWDIVSVSGSEFPLLWQAVRHDPRLEEGQIAITKRHLFSPVDPEYLSDYQDVIPFGSLMKFLRCMKAPGYPELWTRKLNSKMKNFVLTIYANEFGNLKQEGDKRYLYPSDTRDEGVMMTAGYRLASGLVSFTEVDAIVGLIEPSYEPVTVPTILDDIHSGVMFAVSDSFVRKQIARGALPDGHEYYARASDWLVKLALKKLETKQRQFPYLFGIDQSYYPASNFVPYLARAYLDFIKKLGAESGTIQKPSPTELRTEIFQRFNGFVQKVLDRENFLNQHDPRKIEQLQPVWSAVVDYMYGMADDFNTELTAYTKQLALNRKR